MSSLIFHTTAQSALVATDTLAVNFDGSPRQFTSKAFLVQHLKTIVAGTGIGALTTRWFSHLQEMCLGGIQNLDYHTPGALRSLWDEMRRDDPIPPGITTTIYQIGFSEATGDIHTYAYRSTAEFESERLGYGTRYKPECEAPDDLQLPKHLPAMMRSQRAIQEGKPKSERVYIGGEIQVIQLDSDLAVCYTLDRFDDFDDVEAAIIAKFEAQRDHGDDDTTT